MKKFFEEFKTFISRGNVMDMAVGVIIGGAFGAITSSLVSNVITPLLAALFNSPNPDALNITLRAATDGGEPIVLGLGTIINFLVIAFALFSVIKAINKAKEMSEKLMKKQKEEEEAKAAEDPKPTTEELLGEILAELRKQDGNTK